LSANSAAEKWFRINPDNLIYWGIIFGYIILENQFIIEHK